MTARKGTWLAVLGVVLLVGGWSLLRHVLPPSIRTLEGRVADKAGVVGVTAVEPEGNDGLPFQQLAHEAP